MAEGEALLRLRLCEEEGRVITIIVTWIVLITEGLFCGPVEAVMVVRENKRAVCQYFRLISSNEELNISIPYCRFSNDPKIVGPNLIEYHGVNLRWEYR